MYWISNIRKFSNCHQHVLPFRTQQQLGLPPARSIVLNAAKWREKTREGLRHRPIESVLIHHSNTKIPTGKNGWSSVKCEEKSKLRRLSRHGPSSRHNRPNNPDTIQSSSTAAPSILDQRATTRRFGNTIRSCNNKPRGSRRDTTGNDGTCPVRRFSGKN